MEPSFSHKWFLVCEQQCGTVRTELLAVPFILVLHAQVCFVAVT